MRLTPTQVNNAYEVLSDAAKRAVRPTFPARPAPSSHDEHGWRSVSVSNSDLQSYDAAGRVWPPPEASGSRHPDPHFSRRPDPFDPFSFGRGTHAEPFSRDPFAGNLFFSSNFFMPAPPFGANMFGSGLGPQRAQSGAADPWGLSDPFAQFDRFFAALREDPFMRGTSVPVPPAPFGPGAGSGGGPSVGGPPRGSFGDWSAFDNKPGGSTQMQSSYISSHAGGRSGGGDWVSQSHVTRSVNGVTERIVKRVDRQVRIRFPSQCGIHSIPSKVFTWGRHALTSLWPRGTNISHILGRMGAYSKP